MQRAIPRILSINAGFMDTAAFLALKGLFTAHVTGNFVTLGAALVLGTSGALAKLLALPIFCVVVLAVRLVSYFLRAKARPVMSTLLAAQFALTVIGAILASYFGPFVNADRLAALVTGMTFVAAMAIQNAAHRVPFATGCALGALLFASIGIWCFWLPPALLLLTLPMRTGLAEADQ